MEIQHKFEHVEGSFNLLEGKIIAVGVRKYGDVMLSFKTAGMSIAFAKIKLHSRDTEHDAKLVFNDAYILATEIACRFNELAGRGNQSKEGMFYIRKQGYSGNALTWWRPNRGGYTYRIDQAGLYSKEDAENICKRSDTSSAYPADKIYKEAVKVIDSELLDTKEMPW